MFIFKHQKIVMLKFRGGGGSLWSFFELEGKTIWSPIDPLSVNFLKNVL